LWKNAGNGGGQASFSRSSARGLIPAQGQGGRGKPTRNFHSRGKKAKKESLTVTSRIEITGLVPYVNGTRIDVDSKKWVSQRKKTATRVVEQLNASRSPPREGGLRVWGGSTSGYRTWKRGSCVMIRAHEDQRGEGTFPIFS